MNQATSTVRIWDLPTRLCHALLAICVIGLVVTGQLGGEAMALHFRLGYGALTLVLFRLAWGVVGGHWSRFANFVPSTKQLRLYITTLRNHQQHSAIGHNPLGALSVIAMLTVLLLQVFSGLMSDDEISVSGPWTTMVPNAWVELATRYHTEIGKVVLIALVILHLCAVLFYKFVQRDDLITPMLTGDKTLAPTIQPSRDTASSRAFALGILVGCGYAVYRLIQLGA